MSDNMGCAVIAASVALTVASIASCTAFSSFAFSARSPLTTGFAAWG